MTPLLRHVTGQSCYAARATSVSCVAGEGFPEPRILPDHSMQAVWILTLVCQCENLPNVNNALGPMCSQSESPELPFWQQFPSQALSAPKGSLFLWESRTAHQNLLPGERLGNLHCLLPKALSEPSFQA